MHPRTRHAGLLRALALAVLLGGAGHGAAAADGSASVILANGENLVLSAEPFADDKVQPEPVANTVRTPVPRATRVLDGAGGPFSDPGGSRRFMLPASRGPPTFMLL